MTEKRPLGKIRMTVGDGTPERPEPGRHRRATDAEVNIPKPRTSPESESH